MRPFWITVQADGRKNDIGAGPRSNDGTMSADISAKIEGCSVRMVSVYCFSVDKKLRIRTELKNACKYGSLTYEWQIENRQDDLANKSDIDVAMELLSESRSRSGEKVEVFSRAIAKLIRMAEKAGHDADGIVALAQQEVEEAG